MRICFAKKRKARAKEESERRIPMKRAMINRMIGAGFLFLLVLNQAYAQIDPLPSWNDGSAKKAIIEFVKTTTEKGGPKFVPPEAQGWTVISMKDDWKTIFSFDK
jgi:hypothetical protein